MLKHVKGRETGFADKEWGDLRTGFGRQQHLNRDTLTIPWVLPSTQYIANPDLEGCYNEVLTRGHFPSAHRLNIKKGTMWIQDVRTLHRGTPNTSNEPRPEIVVCYGLSWISINQSVKVPLETYEGFSERAKKLFEFCQVIDY